MNPPRGFVCETLPSVKSKEKEVPLVWTETDFQRDHTTVVEVRQTPRLTDSLSTTYRSPVSVDGCSLDSLGKQVKDPWTPFNPVPRRVGHVRPGSCKGRGTRSVPVKDPEMSSTTLSPSGK